MSDFSTALNVWTLLPQRKPDGPVLLNDLERLAFLRKVKEDAAFRMERKEKVTLFPGQSVELIMETRDPLPGTWTGFLCEK